MSNLLKLAGYFLLCIVGGVLSALTLPAVGALALAITLALLFEVVCFPGEATTLRNWYRRLTFRCALCGAKRSKRELLDVYTLGPWCRKCNKRLTFTQLYGMGRKFTRS